MNTPDGMVTVRAVKLYADGALGSRGAMLLEDYTDEPGSRGLPVTARSHMDDVARRAAATGFQVCTHAIGDAGNRLVLDIYAILKTVKSDATPAGMALWIAIIFFLPVIGFILWVLFGPSTQRD